MSQGRKEQQKKLESKDPVIYHHHLSYWLSRAAFIGTHLVFTYWVLFLLNDPLNLGINTLDSRVVLPPHQCSRFNVENIIFDLTLFGLWWGQHSVMARRKFKEITGLWEHPLERPLFAISATILWGANVALWRPISNCSRFDVLAVPIWMWPIPLIIIALAAGLIVGFLWLLPDHVFGTARYKTAPGSQREGYGEIIRGFPYGLVRHPAATGFLWLYWSIPSYTADHIFLASLWTLFIVVGTLIFEEGGLRGQDEFGTKYTAYAKQVKALYPTPTTFRDTFFGATGSHHKQE